MRIPPINESTPSPLPEVPRLPAPHPPIDLLTYIDSNRTAVEFFLNSRVCLRTEDVGLCDCYYVNDRVEIWKAGGMLLRQFNHGDVDYLDTDVYIDHQISHTLCPPPIS